MKPILLYLFSFLVGWQPALDKLSCHPTTERTHLYLVLSGAILSSETPLNGSFYVSLQNFGLLHLLSALLSFFFFQHTKGYSWWILEEFLSKINQLLY